MPYCVLIMRPLLAMVLLSRLACWAAECRNCHPRQVSAWSQSAHAHSLKPALDSRFFQALPGGPIGEAPGGFLLEFTPSQNGLEVKAVRGSDNAIGLISWVFGAGRRAETPLAMKGDDAIELRVSYYSVPGKFDLTLGHHPGRSGSATRALGLLQTSDSVARCFGCHSTGGPPGSIRFQSGVGCVACHAGADDHAVARTSVLNPGRQGAKVLMGVCGNCHRQQPEGDPEDTINVRYQFVRLQRSRCFASGKLTCITCHDPHSDAKSDPAWYRERCLECHPDQSMKEDCLACHMPRVALNSRLIFTDHWILKRL